MGHERSTRPVRISLTLQRKELVIKPICDLVRRREYLVRRVTREINYAGCLYGS